MTASKLVDNRQEISPKKFLVIGGKGLLGASICAALLKDSMEVTCIDSGLFKPSPIYETISGNNFLKEYSIDVANVKEFSQLIDGLPKQDFIINCIGPARPSYYFKNPIHTFSTIVYGTHNVLELATRDGAHYIHCSSSETYGDAVSFPTKENDLCNFSTLEVRSSYAEAKQATETLSYLYHEQKNIKVTIFRLFNIYGPGNAPDDDRVIPALITAVKDRITFKIHGSGEQTRCFTYIDDVVDAFIRCFDDFQEPFSCMNIGSQEEISVNGLVEMIQTELGYHLDIEKSPPRKNIIHRRLPDTSRAHQLLGWKPKVRLLDGLRTTFEKRSKLVNCSRLDLEICTEFLQAIPKIDK